jgi:hypothetical protein
MIIVPKSGRMSRSESSSSRRDVFPAKRRKLVVVFVIIVMWQELAVAIHCAGGEDVVDAGIVHFMSRDLHTVPVDFGSWLIRLMIVESVFIDVLVQRGVMRKHIGGG